MIAVKFCTDIHGPQKMNATDCSAIKSGCKLLLIYIWIRTIMGDICQMFCHKKTATTALDLDLDLDLVFLDRWTRNQPKQTNKTENITS